MEILFLNNTGMSQIICICMLLTDTFLLHNYSLTAYYVPYSFQWQYILKYNIHNYCNIWPNQDAGPIFKQEILCSTG